MKRMEEKVKAAYWVLWLLGGLCLGWASMPASARAAQTPCSPAILELVARSELVEGTKQVRKRMTPVAATCKAWPGERTRTIAALAYDVGQADEKELVVALIDNARSTLVAAYAENILEDAALTIGENSLRIDTARYDLAPGVRAFGVDIASSYSQGCVDGGLGPSRTLFVQDGESLRPVLQNLYLSSWRYLRGGPSCAEARGSVIERTAYDIAVGTAAHHGMRDLRISARKVVGEGTQQARKPVSITLRYDGERYPTPDLDRFR
jgi:hypothetical protein